MRTHISTGEFPPSVARLRRSCYREVRNVHIPDGFLSTPVWASLDIAAAPLVAYTARRAQRSLDENQAPLLGVMGAFVFAAQMIQFPVGPGTAGHLVGGALLAFTLGPVAASIVMTAILSIQALVFQDGGLLALGANIVNMAVLGVWAGYLPFYLWSGARWRKFSIFAGGVLSVLVSAVLALSELLISGIKMSHPVLGVSLALFFVSAILEGAITLAVLQSLERIQPKFVRSAPARSAPVLSITALAAVLLASVGVLFASTAPDGIQNLISQSGVASTARLWFQTPFADYQASFLRAGWLSKSAAGLAGLALIYCACVFVGRLAARNRSV